MTKPLNFALFFFILFSSTYPAEETAPETRQDVVYRESVTTLKGKPGAAEIESALSALVENAANGHPPSELLLAKSFYLGSKVIPQDYGKAFPYIKAAALRNHPWSMNAFASMHEFGQGTERNPSLALNWYRLAATNGHARAMANLGRILISRPANSRDHMEGCAWLYLSRELKDGVGSRTLELIEANIPAGNISKIEDLLIELRAQIRTDHPSTPDSPEK